MKRGLSELSFPILIYDNLCYSCTMAAKLANQLMKDKCLAVGHYTPFGREVKRQIFPQNYEGLEMSWFIIEGVAHGGRDGLIRCIKYIIFDKKHGPKRKNNFNLTDCDTDCKSVKGVFVRSCSIITSHKKFKIVS